MIIVDFRNRLITKDGREIKMRSQLLFRVLVFLANSNGMPRTDREIIDQCWDKHVVVGASNVRIRMCELRKIIHDPVDKAVQDQVIVNVPGIGYKANPKNIKVINQNGATDLIFIKNAKMNGQSVVILQKINDEDEWIVMPKDEYDKSR